MWLRLGTYEWLLQSFSVFGEWGLAAAEALDSDLKRGGGSEAVSSEVTAPDRLRRAAPELVTYVVEGRVTWRL